MKKKFQETTTAFGSNGKLYEIDTETNTCRKVFNYSLEEFTKNTEALPLDEEVAMANTKILYHFLVKRLPTFQIRMKRGKIHANDFKIAYESHGFLVQDMLNAGVTVNINKYHNDLATPEDVADYLEKNIGRVRIPTEQEETKKKIITGLSDKFKVIVTPPKKEEKLPAKKEVTLTQRISNVKRAFTLYKKKRKRDTESLKAKIFDLVDHRSLKVTIAKHFRDYVSKTIKIDKLQSNIVDAITKFDPDFKVSKPAPRFVNFDIEDPIDCNLVIEKEERFYDCTFVGPSGKKYNKRYMEHEFYSRYALHFYPKCMQMLMKVAKGETFNPSEHPNFRVLDKYQDFDYKTIQNTEHKEAVLELAQEVLYWLEQPTAAEFYFDLKNEIKVGDKLKVFFADTHTYYFGVVGEVGTGIWLDYEDGTSNYLLRHQPFKIVK